MVTQYDHETFHALDVNLAQEAEKCSHSVLTKQDFCSLEGKFGFRKMLEYLAECESAALVDGYAGSLFEGKTTSAVDAGGNPESYGRDDYQELR